MTAQTTKLHLIFAQYVKIQGQLAAHPTQTTKLHLIFVQYVEIERQPWQLKLPNYIIFWHNMLKSKANWQLIQLKLPNYTLFLYTEMK